MILLTHERQWRGGETAVAFGMFDGVHEGHAQLMRKANELAALYDLKSVVYTFSSHPMATYAPDRVPPQLETRSEKIRSIAQLGIDAAVLRPFDRAYA
ncbi:MAG: bifunctional riboflavin kinase/FAD synthetase, partial [Christensenellales bacterium]